MTNGNHFIFVIATIRGRELAETDGLFSFPFVSKAHKHPHFPASLAVGGNPEAKLWAMECVDSDVDHFRV